MIKSMSQKILNKKKVEYKIKNSEKKLKKIQK